LLVLESVGEQQLRLGRGLLAAQQVPEYRVTTSTIA